MAEKKTKKRRWRTPIIVVGIIVVIFTVLTISAENFVERELSEHLSRSTQGNYSIKIGKVGVNILNQSVSIQNIVIDSDSLSNKTHYKAHIKELKIGDLAVKRLFKHRKLHMDLMQVSKPTIYIYSVQQSQTDTVAIKAIDPQDILQQIKPFLSSSLFEIAIDECRLEQANLLHYNAYSPNTLLNSIKKLDVEIEGFFVDSNIINQQRFFHSKEVTLSISDLNYALSDSIHHLRIERLSYLLNDHSILGNNFSVMPNNSNLQNKALYWIEIPQVKIKSDIATITNTDSLVVDSLIALDSKIKYRPAGTMKIDSIFSLEKINKVDLYSLIANDLGKFAVNYLLLESKSFIIESPNKSKESQYITDLHFHANHFELDSTSKDNPAKFFYTDDFELSIGNYQYTLNDKVHQVVANNIQLSSYTETFKTNNIQINKLDTVSLPSNFNFACDSLLLTNVDLPKLLHERKMPVGQLFVYSPNIFFEQTLDKENKKNINDVIYDLISNYIEGLYAKRISIDAGKLTFIDSRNANDQKISTDFNLELLGFGLDPTSLKLTSRLFNANSFDISLNNYLMDMNDNIHQLGIEEAIISSNNLQLTINNAHLSPKQRTNFKRLVRANQKSEVLDISIPFLQLNNTNLWAAFFKKELYIKHFIIDQPNVNVERFGKLAKQKKDVKGISLSSIYTLIEPYVSNIDVELLDFKDAVLNYQTHLQTKGTSEVTNKFSLQLEHFSLNKDIAEHYNKLPAQSFRMQIKDQKVQLADEVHSLLIEEINFSSKDSLLQGLNLQLIADPQSQKYDSIPWHIFLSSPKVYLTKVNLNEISFEHLFNVREVVVQNPEIKLYQNFKQTIIDEEKVSFKDFDLPMPKQVKGIDVGRLNFDNGQLMVYQKGEKQSKLIVRSGVDFMIEGASLIESEQKGVARTENKTFDMLLSNFMFSLPKNDDKIKADTLRVSSEFSKLLISEFKLVNKDLYNNDFTFVHLPNLTFEGFSVNDAIYNNSFVARLVKANNLLVDFRTEKTETSKKNKETNKNESFTNMKLEGILAKAFNSIQLDNVIIDDASLVLPNNEYIDTLKRIDINLQALFLDTLESANTFGVESFDISTNSIRFEGENKLYRYSIDRVFISSKLNELSLSGVGVTPLYSIADYQDFFNYQTDYFYASIDKINLTNIGLEHLLRERELNVSKIDVKNMILSLYRDKNKPFNEANRPLMPQELIKSIPIAFNVDTVELQNAIISYRELTVNTPNAYRITFEDTNAKIYPLTNIPKLITENPIMHLNANSSLLGRADLHTRISFNMERKDCLYRLHAELSPLELAYISNITNNAALLSIKSGILNSLVANFEADTLSSFGTLHLGYDKLSVAPLKYSEDGLRERKIASFVANNFIIPSKSKQEVATIRWKRDVRKSIFNYWWRSIASGFLEYLGYMPAPKPLDDKKKKD